MVQHQQQHNLESTGIFNPPVAQDDDAEGYDGPWENEVL
jgi:hypothetical protein